MWVIRKKGTEEYLQDETPYEVDRPVYFNEAGQIPSGCFDGLVWGPLQGASVYTDHAAVRLEVLPDEGEEVVEVELRVVGK